MAPGRCALLFDMDGVVVDSNPVHREAWLEFNSSFGVDTSEAMQERMYGKRNDEIIRDFLGDHLTDAEVFKHGAAKEVLFREKIGPLMPGALVAGLIPFLERHKDLAIGCATNAERANLDFVLNAGHIAHLFEVTVDGHQVPRPKPYPDIYLRAAELLGCEPRRCLVFEDSFAGVSAGRDAGMEVVAIRTTHHNFHDVQLTIDNFYSPELEPFLADFMKRVK